MDLLGPHGPTGVGDPDNGASCLCRKPELGEFHCLCIGRLLTSIQDSLRCSIFNLGSEFDPSSFHTIEF